MAISPDIAAALSHVTGLPVADINIVIRRLREDGLFAREVKGPRSPRPNARQCARLLVAILTGCSARQAPRIVRDAEHFTLHSGDMKHIHQYTRDETPNEIAIIRCENHNIVDILEALMSWSALNPDSFNRIQNCQFTYEVQNSCFHFFYGEDLTSKTKFGISVSYYENSSLPKSFDLEITRSISKTTIEAVGRVLANA